jgi:hypothetical protein
MQIIEVTDFGVRSAVIWMKRRETPLRFVLFPMLHLGTPAFYADVNQRLSKCHLIVEEGVGGGSIAVAALTSAFRIPGKSRRQGLVTQSMDLSSPDVETLSPDINADQFNAGWRRLPVLFRALVLVLVPLFGVWLTLVGPRRAFTKSLAFDDLPSRKEIEEMAALTGALEKLDDLIMKDRDASLLACLDDIHGLRCAEPIDVGIVYGAHHMRAVVVHLSGRYHYWAADAEWMTVLDF